MCGDFTMILIGHALVAHKPFYAIEKIEDIAQTPSNASLLFHFDANLCTYCHKNQLSFALHVKNIHELVLGNALGASYFIVDKSLAINAQKVADDYLFDSKILLLASDENEIEFVAFNAIDGIIFEEGIQAL